MSARAARSQAPEPVMSTRSRWLPLLLLALPALVSAQERPGEEELFGGSPEQRPAEQPAPSPARPPAAAAETEREAGAEERLLGALARTDNPLQIGGVLYLRSNLSSRESTPPSQWTLTAPSLTDLYLDARPNDRVRGFVLGRMQFDPTQGSTVGGVGGVTLPGATPVSNPRVLLDQLWLRFDVDRTAFVTVGRQHVKWGVGRFWNPTDYLHAVRRDPLAVFDERTGTFLAKVHVPWEARGWNFYGVAIFEPLATEAVSPAGTSATGQGAGQAQATTSTGISSQLGRLGAGARAEIVLGGWELGIDGVVQRGIRPRFGLDVSGGILEVDVKGELALRTSSDVPVLQGSSPLSFATKEPQGIRPMALLGAEWTHKYSDEDTYTVGVEYFYNSNGYSGATLYPALLLENAFTPFYLGRHYAGAYLVLPKPGSWNLHTFTLSAIGNLSDRTGVGRLDWSMTLLTHLTLEAYVQGHFGDGGGEFRFSLRVPPGAVPALPGGVAVGASTADLGLALRLNI